MNEFIAHTRPRHPEVTYAGIRDQHHTALVYRNGVPFDPRPSLQFRRHSPSGFEWGYCGSGPAQLALAILLDQYDAIDALEFYQPFKRRVIAVYHEWQRWSLTGCDVHEHLGKIIDVLIDDAQAIARKPSFLEVL